MKAIVAAAFLYSLVSVSGCTVEAHRSVAESAIKLLTVERLYSSPLLTGAQPKGLKVSPDGNRVTFLKGKRDDFRILDLWQFDLTTGDEQLLVDSQELLGNTKETLSDEEKARRERKRIYDQGIVEYQWSEQGDKLLFPINGDIYLYDLGAENPVTRLTETDSFELDPRFSPLGNFVSFVRDYNLFVIRLDDLMERQITFAGTEEQPMGVAEFVAQEEMLRYRGYWWSPNERLLAVAQVDNRPVGTIERFELYADKISLVQQRYPKAGENNAVVSLVIAAVEDGHSAGAEQPTLIPVPIDGGDIYIPQVKWLPSKDRSVLSYSVQSRDQKQLELWAYEVGGRQWRLLGETDPAWVNIRHDFHFLEDTQQLLWVSEKSGYSHIHRYDWQGNELDPLTRGDWEVLQIVAVDEIKGKVYFTATKDSPLEQHLYAINWRENSEPKRITEESGVHQIIMSPKQPRFYIDDYHSPTQPFQVALHRLNGKRDFYINRNDVKDSHPLAQFRSGLSAWEYGDLNSRSGYRLYYKLLKPRDFDPGKKYPLIQFVYGGPGPQLVRKDWGDLFHQLLAQQGFAVLVADNRGTPHRGRDFEREYYLNFGQIEVDDQAEVLQHICAAERFIDCKRVGVFGHSYGGYLTLMLMMRKPELYQVGVAGAPVVDWSLYDTHYTERYLGTPQNNADLYLRANVTNYVNTLRGRLLVVHGMADDNVLYNHSLALYRALQEQGKPFDMMAYPGAKHGIRGKKEWQIHYRNTTLNYFRDHLLR